MPRQSRAREIDLLRFGLEEIERIGPGPAEDVALAAEAVRPSPQTTCGVGAFGCSGSSGT